MGIVGASRHYCEPTVFNSIQPPPRAETVKPDRLPVVQIRLGLSKQAKQNT